MGGVPGAGHGQTPGSVHHPVPQRLLQPDKRNAQVVFSYKPLPGAEDAIYERISDITISMRAGDYLDMPECVVNEVKVDLSEKERQSYDTMRAELVLSLNGEEVDAGNAAALANKLSQMANGAVYGEDKRVLRLHDRKLDALEDLIEAANGKPVLVAYSGSSTTWSASGSGSPSGRSRPAGISPIGTRARSRWRSSTRRPPAMG